MFQKGGNLLLIFSPEKAQSLIDSALALTHDPGTGKPNEKIGF